MKLYIIGSLRNKQVPELTLAIEKAGHEVFSEWYGAGEFADDSWMAYEKFRGRSYKDALKGYNAQHVFQFDKFHLDRCDAAILLYPAGKSGHLEAGYMVGKGKPVWVLMPGEPERWDVMVAFCCGVAYDEAELLEMIARYEA